MGCIMIGIVDACEKYFYDELKSLKSKKFYFKQKKLARLLETPFEKIDRDQRSTLIAYAFHLHCRLLPLGVRHRVIECSGVKCPDEVKLGYEQLKEELENGSDLMPRLSTRMKQIDYSDGMFADWGITHFHLGKKSKNRVERTGPIAYAYLVRDEAYIITIDEHGRWSDQAIFDKLLNEYPHLGEMHNIGVPPSAVADTAAKDRPKFRKEYINTFTISGDCVYLPLGGGVTKNGVMVDAAIQCNRLYKRLRIYADIIELNERKIYEGLKAEFCRDEYPEYRFDGLKMSAYGIIWPFELTPYDATIVFDDWGAVLVCATGEKAIRCMEWLRLDNK